jgi:hypothetical protein
VIAKTEPSGRWRGPSIRGWDGGDHWRAEGKYPRGEGADGRGGRKTGGDG